MIWTSATYRQYLLSTHWAETRDGALRAAFYRCARCGAIRSVAVLLEVHHRTYERIGAEEPGDLEVLCRACHAGEHGIDLPPTPIVNNWEHVRRIAQRVMMRLGFEYTKGAD